METQPASDQQWKRLRADIARLVARRLPGGADVDDVVQEVLVRVWRHQVNLRDGERFGAWLGRVAYNAVVDHQRARGSQTVLPFDETLVETAADRSTPDDFSAVRGLIAAVLRPFVDQLPPPYRETITLSEFDGLSHAEIAQRLSLSVSAIKSRVQRGRGLIKQMLDQCCVFALDARGSPVACEVRPGGALPPGCCATRPDPARPGLVPIGCVPSPARRA